MERWKTHGYIPTEGIPSEGFYYVSHRNPGVFLTDGVMNAPPIDRGVSVEDSSADDETKSPSDEIHETVKTIPYNIKALNKHEPTYKLETFEKNYLVVFNQENIEGYKPRHGTEKDVEAIEQTFSKFGFEVEVHTDFTKAEILDALKIFREKDFTDYGCVAVVVLTHGTYDGLLRAKDQQYSETEIINHFKTHDKPTLITKPKLLIIQACRGARPIPGVFARQIGKIHRDVDDDQGPYTLPIESDMLVLHSSYMGNPSHRDELHGSWFIQALCREIDRLSPGIDIESIMTEVKKAVAIDMEHEEYNRVTGDIDINKQMPVMSSTLIRKLYFKKYNIDSGPSLSLCDGETETYKNEVLDGAAPETPLLTQFGPCLCFLPHFNYLKQCLRHFVEENPDDERAASYLEICETFEDITEFNTSKEKMIRLISQYLEKKIPEIEYLKYLYLYKSE
ncbi:caspase-7-like [Maniola jurtina]|uniref:caspase-7-like n=1 Tax=Maniola jurtina TaxID=191418 RepID=UPI001E687EB4|nr:caspase-7-like [Maniola jurtina]